MTASTVSYLSQLVELAEKATASYRRMSNGGGGISTVEAKIVGLGALNEHKEVDILAWLWGMPGWLGSPLLEVYLLHKAQTPDSLEGLRGALVSTRALLRAEQDNVSQPLHFNTLRYSYSSFCARAACEVFDGLSLKELRTAFTDAVNRGGKRAELPYLTAYMLLVDPGYVHECLSTKMAWLFEPDTLATLAHALNYFVTTALEFPDPRTQGMKRMIETVKHLDVSLQSPFARTLEILVKCTLRDLNRKTSLALYLLMECLFFTARHKTPARQLLDWMLKRVTWLAAIVVNFPTLVPRSYSRLPALRGLIQLAQRPAFNNLIGANALSSDLANLYRGSDRCVKAWSYRKQVLRREARAMAVLMRENWSSLKDPRGLTADCPTLVSNIIRPRDQTQPSLPDDQWVLFGLSLLREFMWGDIEPDAQFENVLVNTSEQLLRFPSGSKVGAGNLTALAGYVAELFEERAEFDNALSDDCYLESFQEAYSPPITIFTRSLFGSQRTDVVLAWCNLINSLADSPEFLTDWKAIVNCVFVKGGAFESRRDFVLTCLLRYLPALLPNFGRSLVLCVLNALRNTRKPCLRDYFMNLCVAKRIRQQWNAELKELLAICNDNARFYETKLPMLSGWARVPLTTIDLNLLQHRLDQLKPYIQSINSEVQSAYSVENATCPDAIWREMSLSTVEPSGSGFLQICITIAQLFTTDVRDTNRIEFCLANIERFVGENDASIAHLCGYLQATGTADCMYVFAKFFHTQLAYLADRIAPIVSPKVVEASDCHAAFKLVLEDLEQKTPSRYFWKQRLRMGRKMGLGELEAAKESDWFAADRYAKYIIFGVWQWRKRLQAATPYIDRERAMNLLDAIDLFYVSSEHASMYLAAKELVQCSARRAGMPPSFKNVFD